jgi:hypothetical protein
VNNYKLASSAVQLSSVLPPLLEEVYAETETTPGVNPVKAFVLPTPRQNPLNIIIAEIAKPPTFFEDAFSVLHDKSDVKKGMEAAFATAIKNCSIPDSSEIRFILSDYMKAELQAVKECFSGRGKCKLGEILETLRFHFSDTNNTTRNTVAIFDPTPPIILQLMFSSPTVIPSTSPIISAIAPVIDHLKSREENSTILCKLENYKHLKTSKKLEAEIAAEMIGDVEGITVGDETTNWRMIGGVGLKIATVFRVVLLVSGK